MTSETHTRTAVRGAGETRAARQRDVGYQAHRLARLLRRSLSRELEDLGFTGPQAAVLLVLAGAEGPRTMSWAAERLGMDRPTCSGVSRRLQRDGWIESCAHPSDGRSRVLRLTPLGEEVLPALRRASSRVSAAALEALEAPDQPLFIDLLARVSDALERGDDAGEAHL
jgi:DNA-binding MarR family transcriptional regulator